MLRNKRLFVVLAIVMAVATVLSGCAGGKAGGKTLRWNLGTEPPTLDPSLATDTTSVQCDEVLFLGLTDFDDKTVEVIPELATEWSVSADGLVWTFKLRKDVEWVNYDPVKKKAEKMGKVTAHDVVYGVKRTVNPETASDYAYVDYIIKNGEAINTGENTDLDSLGVRAVDDYTVEFTLEQPAGYFPGIAGMWINRAQPKQAIDTHGDKWTEPGNIWTNGPYMLEAWEHESKMTFVKNPHHPNAKNVDIDRVEAVMVVEDSTAFAMYENGELDVVAAPSADMDRIKADPVLSKELFIGPRLCTYYYGFNVSKAPMDNLKLRQALSYAIDRQKLIDTVLKGGQRPAKSFACPGIFGGVADDPNFVGVSYDPAKAKQLLAESGYTGTPAITLMFNTSEGHKNIAEFIQGSWKDTLGLDIQLANQEWAVYLKTVNEDAPQIYRLGWCADYPDQNNWVLENFHSTKGSNSPKWSATDPASQAFMAATEKGARESDAKARAAAYFEAEKILVQDQAIIAPIYYYTRVVMNKPYVQRTFAPLGGEHWDKWKITK